MAAKKKPVAWLNRDQLYAMAALSSFGVDTKMAINVELWDGKKGDIVIAIQMRDTSPDQRLKDRHENGFAYYLITGAGHPKPLTEEELAAWLRR